MKKKIPRKLIRSKLLKELSDKETILFDNWLNTGENQQLFHQIESVWKNIQLKAAGYDPDEHNWQKLLSRININGQSKENLSRPFQKIPFTSSINFYRILAVAAMLLLITVTGIFYVTMNNSHLHAIPQSYSSITGKSKILLTDSTEVWLHDNTTLAYDQNSDSHARKVTLEGEAYFKVKHDKKKPFVVNTNGISVIVYGTQFNVNSYASSDKVSVSLYEGSVSMKNLSSEVFLKPHEEGLFDKKTGEISVKHGDIELTKSWTKDQLRFENKTLREVCRYLSKWYSTDIEIDPNIPDNQSYTFTLNHEPLEEIIRIMSRINSIDYQFNENNILILNSKK